MNGKSLGNLLNDYFFTDYLVNADTVRDTELESYLALMQSDTYLDFLVNGINPDGTVDWPISGVVKALRITEAACAINGWTSLDSAIAWLGTDHADQTPAKYHYKTWKQVLKRSKQFEIRAAVDLVSNRGQTWFRSSELV